MDQPFVDVLPILPAQAVHQPHAELTEFALVIAHRLFSHQPLLIEDLLEGEEDLVRVEGLDQVIGHLGTDRLLHDVLLLALCDHHTGQVRTAFLDALQRLQSGESRHVLVEKHHIHDAFILQCLQQGRTIRETGDLVSLALQEEDVRLQQVDLIVGPEDVGSARHVIASMANARNYFVPAAPMQRKVPIFAHGCPTQAAQ